MSEKKSNKSTILSNKSLVIGQITEMHIAVMSLNKSGVYGEGILFSNLLL